MSNKVLKDKTVLVTGAARRLGREMVLGFAQAGANVLVHYHSSGDQAAALAEKLKRQGYPAFLVQADLRDRGGIAHVVQAAESQFDKLDALINNASVFPQGHILQADSSYETDVSESFRETLAINLEAPFYLIQQLKPLLLKSSAAKVINMLDAHACDGLHSRPAYAASKAGLAALTKSIAAALAPEITVCGLALGKVLPGEGMSPEEVAKVDWIGCKPVVQAVLKLIKEPQKPGRIVVVD